MSKEETKDLMKFLKPFPPEVREMALWLREFVWELYPDCNELIYDNYNALALGWSPTDRLGHSFCSIAAMARYVHFGFYWGSEIADPEKILLGKGNQYRYIIVSKKSDFPRTYIKRLLKEAYANSMAKVKSARSKAGKTRSGTVSGHSAGDKGQIMKGKTFTRSVSPVKKRPGINLPGKKR